MRPAPVTPPSPPGLKVYPNYMMGGGYVMSGEVCRVLVDVHARMPLKFTPIEDATLGFWLMNMDLRHVDHPRFYTWAAPCCFKAPVRCARRRGALLAGQGGTCCAELCRDGKRMAASGRSPARCTPLLCCAARPAGRAAAEAAALWRDAERQPVAQERAMLMLSAPRVASARRKQGQRIVTRFQLAEEFEEDLCRWGRGCWGGLLAVEGDSCGSKERGLLRSCGTDGSFVGGVCLLLARGCLRLPRGLLAGTSTSGTLLAGWCLKGTKRVAGNTLPLVCPRCRSPDPWLVLHKIDSPTKMRYVGAKVANCSYAQFADSLPSSIEAYVPTEKGEPGATLGEWWRAGCVCVWGGVRRGLGPRRLGPVQPVAPPQAHV